MKCPLCNAEIKEGSLYCEVCGEDIHIVPDFDPVIDDTSNKIIGNMTDAYFGQKEDKKSSDREPDRQTLKSENNTGTEKNGASAGYGSEPSRKKSILYYTIPKPISYIVVILAFVLIIATTVLAIVFFTSAEYKLDRAAQAYNSGDYAKAAVLYEGLLQKNRYDVSLLEKYSLALYSKGDTEGYVDTLIEIFDSSYATKTQRASALAKLVAVYDSQGDYEKIQQFILSTGDEELIRGYRMYFPEKPKIITEEGEYSLPQLLVIESEGEDPVYYTLKLSKDTFSGYAARDELYTGPVLLEEGLYEVSAYTKNEKGVTSEIAEARIDIIILPPPDPVISPKSGTYDQPVNIEIENYSESNVGFYYTIDGSTPNASSLKYTAPIVMLPGVSNYRFVCINENGMSSEVIDVKYNFDIEYVYDVANAYECVMNYLYDKGTTISHTGELEFGGNIDIVLSSMSMEESDSGEKVYKYIFDEYVLNGDGDKTALDTRFSVDVITGEVERL